MSRLSFVKAKVISLQQASQMVELHRLKNHKIVFTNGCFDLLHLGHITYLAQAASLGDKLIVGLNNDASVRKLEKGENRPLNPEVARAIVLASLGFVDHVVVFSEETPLNTILTLKPDIIVKGGDYDAEISDPEDKRYIVGKNQAASWGGKAQTIPLVEGYSTTSLISKR